ncbi:glycosyltransferase, exosortase A system-associated [Parahaliea sp. F7430]|uniref:Glycosyltransferase, exosortase A system-associated n=1 Tax=Sediminihaliea albiluteola TaxID=2758564 RepID=A0A7W2TVH7_9GAMM|nr:TIGR04063 family PEP-CTERM/XrtA system glycosyltransferase [Sediminihaliea albiluteola]MBA6412704.1 glycosyltransferase, exosortase A system-associated [Sediminihaliea albiluteola]
MKSPHILHVLDHSIPMHSGYTFRTRSILQAQRELGWTTSQVTGLKHSAVGPMVEEVDGFTFYRTAPGSRLVAQTPILKQWQVVTSLEARLNQLVEELRPDILHAHSPALNGLAALRVGRKYSLPVVYECRAFWEDAAVDHGTSREGGPRYSVTRALETRVFQGADAVTTICEGLRADIVKRGIAPERVTVIPNAVNAEAFASGRAPDAALLSELGLSDKIVLGFIGSFYAYEGLPILLDALAQIRKQRADVVLLLVGGGPQEALVKQRIVDLGLEQSVVYVGRVPHAEVQRYYSLVDVFVYPRESMRLTELVTPLKPLEAMAEGKLVVASDVGGHRELIRHGENGLLFEAGNPVALATAIDKLLQQRALWPVMQSAGRDYVECERNWPTSVARYADVYRSVM